MSSRPKVIHTYIYKRIPVCFTSLKVKAGKNALNSNP